MQIYFDNTLIDEDYYSNLSTNFALFDTSFTLGSTASNKYSLSILKEGVAVQPTFVNIMEDSSLIASLVVDSMEEDDFFYKYELTDRMVELDIPYDASAIFENGGATLLAIAQDICSRISTELATTDFNGYDKVITWYDTRITAREYLGYIAELNGGYAQIGKDGKMYFLKQKQESANTIEIDDCADYEIGERHKISRVVYQLGALKYEFGDETYDTLYLNPNNVFITEESDVQAIYNDIVNFEFYSFKTSNCPIDFNIYAGQIITFTDGVNNYPTIAGYNLQYYGGWFGGYELNVNTTKQEETKIIDDNERIKALNIVVNRDENILLSTVEQTDENKEEIAELKISTKEIKQEVGKIEVLTSEVTGIQNITLENCIPGKLMELHIVGNNNVFKPLYLGNSTILGDNTILNGNSTIIVNSTEYELGIEEELRSNSDVSDEFILKDGKSYIVRRVDAQGQTLENEIIEQLDDFTISLIEDSNTISIKSYSANIRAVYIPHNDYNDTFATQIEMNAAIIVSADQILSTVNQAFSNYSTTTQMNSAITQKANEITSEVSQSYSTKEETATAKTEAISSADANTDNKLVEYSTTIEMNSAITQKADEINSSINTAKTEAITTANNNTDTKLTEYSKTTEMNSAITQKANEITSEVSTTYSTKAETVTAKNQAISSANSSTDSKLNNYSTTSQMNSAITQKANEITSSVSETYSTKTETTNGLNEKVNNSDFGTKITQNPTSVKTAWNQISENIQLETIGNNAALSIYNGTNRLMALTKDGQNFYKDGNKFGSMGVMKVKDSDADNYGLAFVLDGFVVGNDILPANNFMGFCYKVKDNNGNEIIYPYFYLGKLQNSQYGGIHMSSDMYFEGSSIITDSTLEFKNSLDNIIFRIDGYGYGSSPRGIVMNGTHHINGLMYYNNSIINNIINTYGQSVDPGLYAITTALVLGSNSQNRTLYLVDENGDSVWISEDSSDRKLKYDIKDTTVKALELVNKIKHRKFKWKADSSEQKIGYIAQELEEIDKNLVVKIKKDLNNESEEDENYKYQVNNVALNALSTKAIQELYMLVQNQQKQIDELQREVEKLRREK